MIHLEKNVKFGVVYKELGFPWWLSDKEFSCNAGDTDLIPGWGRSPGEGNGSPLQYSCLENPWSEEPGELQSIGSHRVKHNLPIKQEEEGITKL